ncbi:hypothetical protein IW138_002931 [Coemansia sp. RSA 986]|nr:hypothetical protein IW138_002931 [Coemansia sp. RSA 986]
MGTETSGDKPQSDSTRSVTGTEAQNGSNGSATNTAKEQNGDGDDEGYSTADRSDMNQDGYTGASSNRSASSKKNAIIGAVCGTLGGIILACLSLYFYKRWQRSHKNVYKDKDAQITKITSTNNVNTKYISG